MLKWGFSAEDYSESFGARSVAVRTVVRWDVDRSRDRRSAKRGQMPDFSQCVLLEEEEAGEPMMMENRVLPKVF